MKHLQEIIVDNFAGGGMILAYREAPAIPFKIISDPYEYNGQMVVTAKTHAQAKKSAHYGLYSVASLVAYKQKE